jgi:tetratricopeptide (TPR) repeat protein
MISAESSPPAAPGAKVAQPERRPAGAAAGPGRPVFAGLADAGLIVLFLGLTFLLGVFPLKDTDIFWHLRTGQIIRQTGQVPSSDLFTYSRPGAPWIDLHWIFQVAVSWLYERGGAAALNLAKCVVTCVAMLILVTCRRRDWPLWVTLVAWLPALLVLGGRMYVRPETLSLLYLAVYLAVLTRWDRHPMLVAILPLVQVAWVNSHGLFVFGPILLVLALLDAAVRPRSLAPGPGRWWRIVGIGALATLAACLVNPYGIRGAVYPIELAGTMTNEIFSHNVAELTPIPQFIRRAGLGNLPLQLHFVTMTLGALSFLVPLVWAIVVGLSGLRAPSQSSVVVESAPPEVRSSGRREVVTDARSNSGRKKASTRSRKGSGPAPAPAPASWRLSPFRLLLFAAFSYLSLQATRNSHQFAAVVGSVTAWNFAEWAAAVRRRRGERRVPEATSTAHRALWGPRLLATGAILAVLAWVGSGVFYRMTGEGRTIGLGEAPLFFAHEAVRFAGRPEMPDRFISFHNGHASLFEFYYGPERKVYTDPRLEVAGPDLFARYMRLDSDIKNNARGWQAELDYIGRPVVLVDHEYNWGIGSTMLADDHWRCVWFDPIAAVFVHDTAGPAAVGHVVNFAARHFRPDSSSRPLELIERVALAKVFRSYVAALPSHRPGLIWPFVWLGEANCRVILREEPDSAIGWMMLGQTEIHREPPPSVPSPRYRLPFNPAFDLSLVRATYALRHGLEREPDNMITRMWLSDAYARRGMHEAALPVLDRLATLAARHPAGAELAEQFKIEPKRAMHHRELGDPPATTWRNLAELEDVVNALLASGRAEAAADILVKANPPERSSWEVLDRMATLRLHLGEPARARALWQQGMGQAPDPAAAASRIGATYLAEADFDAARRAYRRALEAKPGLFEACYSLAVLEQDAGDATAAYQMARKAVAGAPDDHSREAAQMIVTAVEPYVARPSAAAIDAGSETERAPTIRPDTSKEPAAASGGEILSRMSAPVSAASPGRPSNPRRAS